MVDLDRTIEVKWGSPQNQYFISKGYEYTNAGDIFMVKIGDLPITSSRKIPVNCDICGKEKILSYCNYTNAIEKNGIYICSSCSTKAKNSIRCPKEIYFDRFIEFCKIHNYTPISTITDYENINSKLFYLCPIHGEQWTTVASINANDFQNECKICGNMKISERKKHSIEYIISIVESKNNDKLLNPNDYIDMNTSNMIILCGSCNDPFTTSIASINLNDGKCMNCVHKLAREKLRLTEDDLNNKYNNGGKILLNNPQDYIKNNICNLSFNCKECGDPFITSMVSYDAGHDRCKKCSKFMTKPECKIKEYLDKHNILNVFQHYYDDCKDKCVLPFDFFLPEYNTAIEFDGIHHYKPIYGDDNFKKTQLHDMIKNQYCKDNRIKLIRIPYWDEDNIELIINQELHIGNFTKIKYIPSKNYRNK